ncbi:MAG TPA: ammonia channel protein, partial [Methylomicrobium sp.]|nr:ammonia channel protein [Methylomicrobium sp.]
MKQLIPILSLLLLIGFAGISFADPATDVVQTTTLADPVKPVTEALSTTAATVTSPAEAAPPTVNKGDTAWMIVATVLVILMVVPGLALFYGGMVRAKNMLSILMQVFVIFSLMAVLWAIYGYSVAFTEGNAFFGGFSKMLL